MGSLSCGGSTRENTETNLPSFYKAQGYNNERDMSIGD